MFKGRKLLIKLWARTVERRVGGPKRLYGCPPRKCLNFVEMTTNITNIWNHV